MDESLRISTPPQDAESARLNRTSEPFVGQWNRLVSTTNWEKGRIILEWREALVKEEAHPTEFSDEAWSRYVGGVSAQHVGRLRRVFQRFGQVRQDYDGLFWSHFQAALDWNDAEMWLEGAVHNRWSVSQMRRTRWQTLGAVADEEPRDEQIVASELDEDFEPNADVSADPTVISGEYAEAQSAEPDESPADDDLDQESAAALETPDGSAKMYADESSKESVDLVQPFENLAELPEDLAEAFESYKLAILRHKTEQWQQISQEDVLASLDALKELVRAPSADDAPF